MKAPAEWIGYEETFGVKNNLRHYDYEVKPVYSNTPANVLWPGEKIRFTFQLTSNIDRPIDVKAQVHVIQYGTKGLENDVWWPVIYAVKEVQTIPVTVQIVPNGYINLDIAPDVPDVFGGYAVVFDLGEYGRQLAVSFVRSMKPSPIQMQYPKQSLDDLGPAFLNRVGVQAIRYGIPYCPTNSQKFQYEMRRIDADMKKYKDSHITVMLMFGEGQENTLMPLGAPRAHLDDRNVFKRTKQDYSWMPELDADFTGYVRDICLKHGWPDGPVTAVQLWNEPWEGASISGWQADMIRYKEIYTAMAKGVLEARGQGADVLMGGCDSFSNAWDKFFSDGTMDMLPVFDFLSIHYQGMDSPVLYPEWNNRKDHKGRVLIWDTESWVGNTDDRVGLVIAANRSAGYDRSMGIFGGYMYTGDPHDAIRTQTIHTANGKETIPAVYSAWSTAAAMGAVQSMIGERDFKELLFKNGLPWVMLFDGYNADPDDGTVVIAGDLGDAFGKENILFRSVELKNGKMTVKAHPDFRLYDFYGNVVASSDGYYEIPLTCKGYFMRTNGKKGSFNQLIAALKTARIEGYAPVEIIAKDFTAPISGRPEAKLVITNILNRKISGNIQATIGGLSVSCPAKLSLNPHQTVTVPLQVTGGEADASNIYPLNVRFDAGKDGIASHTEDLHVNFIHKRTIQVDGKLDDWTGAIPQTVTGSATASISLTEAAWFPFKEFDKNAEGFANAYLAYDDQYFYFAAKVADKTPTKGSVRFETLNEDDFFYPDTAYHQTINAMQSVEQIQTVDNNDRGALQHPSESRRISHYLENTPTVQSIGMDLDLPVDRYTQTAFYFPNINQPALQITVFNRETGQELLSQLLPKAWNGAYIVLNLSGNIQIRCSTGGWQHVNGWRNTAKLAGVFFDEGQPNIERKTSARLIGKDFDTQGDWKSAYGGVGYYIVGLPPQLPQNITCKPTVKDDKIVLKWPEGIRHFSYRKNPNLPDASIGDPIDNILIAFNVLPIGQDGMESHPKGTMPRYTGYKCTDYEYALNTVVPEYGGGFEIWRLLVPGMPRKHFYPRQPKSPFDGPVKEGKLVTAREGNTLYTECAIPWTELPDVKQALDKGGTIKFSYRINDDGAKGACLELANGRSVSKKNSKAFHPDFKDHWANEVEFGAEK
ncbi:hypothetical protein AGMMS50239_09490 [Bacteroidia bacterium]|nr:hypothetical protein AGMMS50239_09490 [Bacteroidia bacterium]